VNASVPVDEQLAPASEDLAQAPVDSEHHIVFSEQQRPDGGYDFLVNGKVFDPTRVDETMKLDQVAEWVIENDSSEWHTFHIHVNDFQVTDVQLHDVPDVSPGAVTDVNPAEGARLDTVTIPPRATVTMRTRPVNFTGKFVFHCHMLFHEDHGMMGVVEVTKP
jgi:FtsP/CotA-like multicopper oxidase with cupredoxin domain